MDAKVTKRRLGVLLSYDWLKILGLIAGVIVIWSLVFTMTATRITPAQQFTVFNHYANASVEYTSFYDHYERAKSNDVFSYEVLENDVIDLPAAGEQYIYTMCDTRFATSEGDMMFVPNILDTSTEELGEKQMSYPETFTARYRSVLCDWDTFMQEARTYLNSYFGGNYKTGELNKEKAERIFRSKVEQSKDKRFRRKSKLEQGVKDEYTRLQKYRDALVQLEAYLEDGTVKLQSVQYKDGTGEPYKNADGSVFDERNYLLNICPDESKASKLKNLVYYGKENADGAKVASAQDMCVMLFKLEEMDENFQYETLLYVNHVIASSLT